MHLRSPRDAPIDFIAPPVLANPENAPELPIELVMYITKPRGGPGRRHETVSRIRHRFDSHYPRSGLPSITPA
jgi:hypothetical protein